MPEIKVVSLAEAAKILGFSEKHLQKVIDIIPLALETDDLRRRLKDAERNGNRPSVWRYARIVKFSEEVINHRLGRRLLPNFEPASMALFWDMLILLNPSESEDQRQKAAQSILDSLDRLPIPFQRYKTIVKPALQKLAQDHRNSEQGELKVHVTSALYQTAIDILTGKNLVASSFDEAMAADRGKLKTGVAKYATESIVPEWRKYDKRTSHGSKAKRRPAEPTAAPQPTRVPDSENIPDIDKDSGKPVTPETILMRGELLNRDSVIRERLVREIAIKTRKSESAVKMIIEQKKLHTAASLARAFRIERTRFYREIWNPMKNNIPQDFLF